MHEAKTHFSKLVQKVEQGEEVIIARAGKPTVKLVLIEPGEPQTHVRFVKSASATTNNIKVPLVADSAAPTPPRKRRIGVLDGMFAVPDDFDTMFEKEIDEMFYGPSEEAK